MQKNEITPYSYVTHRINSKWTKELNIRPENIKILEENIGSKISDIGAIFFMIYLLSQEKISKWDYTKLKSFCTAKWKPSSK